MAVPDTAPYNNKFHKPVGISEIFNSSVIKETNKFSPLTVGITSDCCGADDTVFDKLK